MGFKCGIVGLPNVGKSTLFNALTQTAAAQAANYPFCTIEPNTGDVAVPDPRLEKLAKIASSKEIIPTRLTFVDIAGLVRGASKGEGLGNQFLANIRECDAIAHVVRCFEDSDITHVEGKIAPQGDIETVETELMLADLESLEKRAAALGKESERRQGGQGDCLGLRSAVLHCCARENRRGLPQVKEEEQKLFKSLGLLSAKPVLYVGNVEEAAAGRGNSFSKAVEVRAAEEGAAVVIVSAKIESEIAVLAEDEQKDYLEAVGLAEPGLEPRHPRGLWAFAADHFFHRRAEGDPRVDHPARNQGAAGGGGDSHGFRKGLYSRRDHRLCRLCRLAMARRGRGRRANSASKARTTSSRTATCCISGSRPDMLARLS